ncbi:mitochondrial ribosomal subunit S27-domain-containing protein [Podospora didyma]|uniref:Small ribosomal subunit protein mS33 n=1 Tax=Podospora didyma TaxID=330526 RepID=A0AAE0NSP3_9PEZI|nr:mitochondrial ribosomal subunit S27-domain-containing protein [Podospora didyma]
MSNLRARMLDLLKVQCKLFSTTYNPDGIRAGNKILRQRLRGPALAAYYPRKAPGINELQKEFANLELLVEDLAADDRLEHITALKARGKSAPKKKKGPTADKKR